MRAVLPLLLILAGCSRAAPAAGGNDAQRQADLIANQGAALQKEAESNLAVEEQALEKEGEAIFENRAALLNETAGNEQAENATAPDAPSTK